MGASGGDPADRGGSTGRAIPHVGRSRIGMKWSAVWCSSKFKTNLLESRAVLYRVLCVGGLTLCATESGGHGRVGGVTVWCGWATCSSVEWARGRYRVNKFSLTLVRPGGDAKYFDCQSLFFSPVIS